MPSANPHKKKKVSSVQSETMEIPSSWVSVTALLSPKALNNVVYIT